MTESWPNHDDARGAPIQNIDLVTATRHRFVSHAKLAGGRAGALAPGGDDRSPASGRRAARRAELGERGARGEITCAGARPVEVGRGFGEGPCHRQHTPRS